MDIGVAISISFTTAIVWTSAHIVEPDDTATATNINTSGPSPQGRQQSGTTYSSLNSGEGPQARKLWHIMPSDNYDPEDKPHGTVSSPALMVIVGILKSKGIYDPYVFMGNWGGSHKEVTADGDLILIPTTSGNYSVSGGTNTITININSAKYKTGSATDTPLELSLTGTNNTLVLTSTTNITDTSKTYNLTREPSGLNLTLKTADDKFTAGTYNVSLKIERDIDLGSTCSTCKLKKTTDSSGNQNPVSLGTYSISGNSTAYTGTPQENDIHSSHTTEKCCIFGSQNTWSTDDPNNRYGWHSFIILAPLKICLAITFVYSLHHRDSAIARSIVDQPKMSTFLSIIFYMCHEIMLAMGFPLITKDVNST